MKQKKQAGAGATAPKQIPFNKWINSYPIASKWLEQYDIVDLLEQNGGLVKIPNFLPEHVAEGIYQTLTNIPESQWNNTAAREDYTQVGKS